MVKDLERADNDHREAAPHVSILNQQAWTFDQGARTSKDGGANTGNVLDFGTNDIYSPTLKPGKQADDYYPGYNPDLPGNHYPKSDYDPDPGFAPRPRSTEPYDPDPGFAPRPRSTEPYDPDPGYAPRPRGEQPHLPGLEPKPGFEPLPALPKGYDPDPGFNPQPRRFEPDPAFPRGYDIDPGFAPHPRSDGQPQLPIGDPGFTPQPRGFRPQPEPMPQLPPIGDPGFTPSTEPDRNRKDASTSLTRVSD